VVDLAAYRIVQEALTNAARHAGSVAVAVSVVVTEDAVELSIENAAGSPAKRVSSAGVGLLGIGERVALLGGTLEAGQAPGGGYRLAARLPLEGRSS
jgi:signal transduction histidine kinase